MKRVFFAVLTIVILFGAGAAAYAEVGRSPWVFDVGLRLWGLDLGVGYRGLSLLDGVDTTFWAYSGGAWEKMTYYRVAETIISGAYTGGDPVFYRADANWQLGIGQGFLWNDRIDANRLEAFLFYRGRYNANLTEAGDLILSSGLPDSAGMLLNTFFLGLAYDDVLFDKAHKMKSGISAEISAEYGPGFLFNAVFGNADFVRLNLTGRGFYPLYDAQPHRRGNLFSMYIADFAAMDWAVGLNGAPVPYVVRRSFGGRDAPRTGLGYAVRGVDSGSLDTNLKLVNNLELRMNLPAIGLPDIVPGVVLHWDAGYFSQVGEPSIPSPLSGFVSTIGAGIYVNLFDIATLAAYMHYRLDDVNADGSALVPFDLQFGLHF
jgi:hypothetical protein